MRRKKGFTLIELLVVIAIIALLISILVPAIQRGRELARQTGCQANVSAIGKAIMMYSTNDGFPLMGRYGDPNAPIINYTVDPSNVHSLLTVGTGQSNAMNNVWFLINAGYTTIEPYRCPSDLAWTRWNRPGRVGWTAPTDVSYGMHWLYDGPKGGTIPTNPARITNADVDPKLIIMADYNPGGAVSATVMPSNHPEDGETCLRRDSTVFFYKSAVNSNAGMYSDDIYTNGSGAVGGMPTSVDDTSIATTR
ncbi:MAG: prepilin-type N-terminal cleavage/methylation domain-containing protein [Planctomycetaceae bacterium]|nr:MAG: prepilin-type N-terminal cleavage/methylation domain-containing protein [Planctomycetaceae bacterium]